MRSPPPDVLTFDEPSHVYRWNDRVVPNVTRILSVLSDWSKVAPDVLERARQEGVDIHRCVELHAKNDLDEETLPEWLRPRLAAWKLFLAETGFEIEASEARVYHDAWEYAGTADLFGTFGRLKVGRTTKRVPANVDLKRSFIGGRSIGLQTAAYSVAWQRMGNPKPQMRCALQLRDDATYRLRTYDDAGDFSAFTACLQVHKLKEEIAA